MYNISDVATDVKIFSYTVNQEISFKGFVTDFSDTFNAKWSNQEVYGRMDPVYNYKNTVRKITLNFDVPSGNLAEAINNAKNADIIIQGMYPIYEEENVGAVGQSIMRSSPFFKIKLSNLIRDRSSVAATTSATSNISAAKEDGLLGFMDNFNFKPEISMGFFRDTNVNLYPKLYKVNLSFSVIHEHPLGSKVLADGTTHTTRIKSGTNNFPHGYTDTREKRDAISTPPSTPSTTVSSALQSGGLTTSIS